MFKVKLIKLNSSHNNLRTPEIVGVCEELPIVGSMFSMTGDPLELDIEEGIRFILTTPIIISNYDEVNKQYIFSTANSHYKLEVIEEII